ncbi:MAG: DegT/DnrJ/EryC1/StrS family aminotransferase [Planctomycetota bacterium]
MDAIPFIDLKAQYAGTKDQVRAVVDAVFEDQAFILGETVSRFEEDYAAWLGLPKGSAVGVSSGTDALLVTLMALGVGPGDKVLTTPFSFFATAGVIARLHATPVFVDIDPITFNLDPAALKGLDPEDFKALIVVHLYGRCADMRSIRDWADASGLPLVEDAAQAVGAKDEGGAPVGGLGRAACFSFFPTKNLGAAGDGGCVTSLDPEFTSKIRALRTHGAVRPYDSDIIGGNFRLDALQAAVLGAKLPFLDDWNRRRLENAAAYNQYFRDRGLEGRMGLPELPLDDSYVAHQYVLRLPNRDEVAAKLAEQGIGCAIYYPKPLHLMDCFSRLGYAEGSLPEAERASREVLALPIFPELGQKRHRRVAEAVAALV